MRAAAKVVGIGVLNSGLRGAQAENPFAAAVRRATRPVSAVVSSSEDVQLAPPQDGKVDAPVQRTCWGIDDWEFAGGEEELVIGSGEPVPRLVFGGVPTIQETEEATSELKDVLDKAYLSSKSPKSNSEHLETKACVVSEATVTAPVSKHAIQAFRFLNESPAAQSVVASIACDPKVWTAVLQNEAVMGFLQSHQTSVPFADKSVPPDAESESHQSPNWFGESSSSGESESGNWFTDYLQKVRVTVVEMMSSLSDFFQNIFSSAYEHVSMGADGSGKESIMDKTVGASLMGLAVMVIMVVVLKRG